MGRRHQAGGCGSLEVMSDSWELVPAGRRASLAVSERVHEGSREQDVWIWHLPAGDKEYAGDCDFHAVAYSGQEGIVLPAPQRDVPLDHVGPNERWCVDRLAITRTTEDA